MKAMLFAAGKGTRLGALGQGTPKCLLRAGEKTLLEYHIERMEQAGISELVMNTHHLAKQVEDFVRRLSPHLRITLIHEPKLLETGGGLFNAAPHFQGERDLLVMNADLYSNLDLKTLIQTHQVEDNLVTLAVSERETSRYLHFDNQGLLCGWENRSSGERITWTQAAYHRAAFGGIQVVSTRIFSLPHDLGDTFSSIPLYLQLARRGERISKYDMGDAYWMDVGTLEKLEKLQADLHRHPRPDSNPNRAGSTLEHENK